MTFQKSLMGNVLGLRSIYMVHNTVWDKIEKDMLPIYPGLKRPNVNDTVRRLNRPLWSFVGKKEYVPLLRKLYDQIVCDILIQAA